MAQFSTAKVQDVMPKRKIRQPSQRSQVQALYQEALRSAIIEKNEALVVEIETEDKALTLRNRIKRAADSLGIEHITIRRRRDRLYAYVQPRDVPGE